MMEGTTRILFRITFVFSKVEPNPVLRSGSTSATLYCTVYIIEPSPVSCLLSPVSCLLSPVSRLLSLASCLPPPISCLPSPVSHLLSSVSRPVSCLLSPVSCLPCCTSAADLIDNDYVDLAVLWSKLADLGHLAILTLLADWNKNFLANMQFSGLRFKRFSI